MGNIFLIREGAQDVSDKLTQESEHSLGLTVLDLRRELQTQSDMPNIKYGTSKPAVQTAMNLWRPLGYGELPQGLNWLSESIYKGHPRNGMLAGIYEAARGSKTPTIFVFNEGDARFVVDYYERREGGKVVFEIKPGSGLHIKGKGYNILPNL